MSDIQGLSMVTPRTGQTLGCYPPQTLSHNHSILSLRLKLGTKEICICDLDFARAWQNLAAQGKGNGTKLHAQTRLLVQALTYYCQKCHSDKEKLGNGMNRSFVLKWRTPLQCTHKFDTKTMVLACICDGSWK